MREPTADEIKRVLPTVPVQRYTELRRHLFVASDGTLCKRANAASAVKLIARNETLPTRISPNASRVLAGLRELVDAGLMTTAQTQLYDRADGVHVETIPLIDYGDITNAQD